jgi:membrane fusion protein, multidrug efflux system
VNMAADRRNLFALCRSAMGRFDDRFEEFLWAALTITARSFAHRRVLETMVVLIRVRLKAVVIVFGGVLLFCSCGKAPSASSDPSRAHKATGTSGTAAALAGRESGAGATVPVVTAHVVKKPVAVTIPAVGTVEAISTVQIKSQVTGQLTAINFKEGDEVRKGQLLFSIDPRPFQAAVDQAQAALARDTATSANQQTEEARYTDLFQRGIISREQYDAQTATAQASASTLQVDRAAIETAQLNQRYTRITAPIAGRTGSLGVHIGDIVQANSTTAMVVINQVSPIYVTFSVPGRYLAEIRQFQAQHPLSVQGRMQSAMLPGAQQQTPSTAAPDVQPGAVTGTPEDGTVTFIDNSVDATTGTIKLRGSFDNTDRALWPGLFVQITLNLTTDPNALVVPAVAVQASQDGQYVYVVTADHTAQMRPVTVARQQADEMVIAKGLSAGEEVVTDGQLRLTPGARVSVDAGRGGAQPEGK